MHNCRWLKAQVLGKECCCNKLAETIKELEYKGIETNLEQCRCCSRCYSNSGSMIDWIGAHHLKFPKMEDTHLILSVALIISYKRSTLAKEKMSSHQSRRKFAKKTTREQKSWDRLKVETEEKSQRSISCLLFIYRDVFDSWTNVIYCFIVNYELNLIVLEW